MKRKLWLIASIFVAANAATARQTPPSAQVRPKESPPSADDDRGAARALAVSAATGKREYRPLEPIVVDVEVENVGGIIVDTPATTSVYARTLIEAHRLNSGRVRATTFGETALSPVRGGKLIAREPGARFKETLVVNRACDMTMPGEYEIVVGIPVADLRSHEAGATQPKVEASPRPSPDRGHQPGVAHSKILRVTVAGEPVDGVHPKRLEPPRTGKP